MDKENQGVGNLSGPITELLAFCCVKLVNGKRGTGCFVAPALVLTCAHVIPDNKVKGDVVFIQPKDADREFEATVIELSRDDDEDYCLLSVKEYRSKISLIIGTDVLAGDKVFGYGYPVYDNQQRSDGFYGEYEALTGAPDPVRYPHGFHKIKNTQIMPGFSGSPVISLRTGQCIGIMTESRNRNDALGGWAIPTSLLLERLSQIEGFGKAPAELVSLWNTALTTYKSLREIVPSPTVPRDDILYSNAQLIIENFIYSYTGDPCKPTPFGGRKEELLGLDTWLDDVAESPYSLYTGPAGHGKSALLVHWLMNLQKSIETGERTALTIIFVPISIRFDFNTEERVFAYILDRLHALNTQANTATNTTREYIRQFSRLIWSNQRYQTKVLLIMDGLDEAAGWDVNASMFPLNCSPDIKVLLSARDMAGRAGRQWLECLGWEKTDNAKHFQLAPLTIQKLKDALEETGAISVSKKGGQKLYHDLFQLTGGDPLTLGLILEELIAKKTTIDSLKLDALEPGLEGFFNRWWREQEQLWGKKINQMAPTANFILHSLALLFSPISIKEFSALVRRYDANIDGYGLDEMIAVLGRFVLRTQNGKALTISHPKFSEFLVNKLRRYDDLKRYEDRFLDWGSEVITSLSSPGSSPPPAYMIRNLALHLLRADAPIERFEELLHTGWESGWKTIDDSYGGYSRDITIVYERLKAHDLQLVNKSNVADKLDKTIQCASLLSNALFEEDNIKPGLLGSLLKYQLWSTDKVLNFIARVEHPYNRGLFLEVLFELIETSKLEKAAVLAEQVVLDPNGDYGAAMATYAWMKRLGKEERLNEAITVLSKLAEPERKSFGYLGLAAALPADQRGDAITTAFSNTEELGGHFLSSLVDLFTKEFIPYAQKTGIDQRQKLTEEEYQSIRENIIAWISEKTGTPFDSKSFDTAYDTQYLGYLFPFIPEAELFEYMTRVLREMSRGKVKMYADDYLIFSRGFLTPPMLPLIEPAIEKLKSDEQILGILACYPFIEDQALKKRYKDQIIENIGAFEKMPSINDRKTFFDLLGRSGFTAAGVRKILQTDKDDWYIDRPIAGIAPYLSIEECEVLLKSQSTWRNELRDRIIGPVLERYASFSPRLASLSLQLLNVSFSREEWLRGRLVLDAYSAGKWTFADNIDRLNEIGELSARIDVACLLVGGTPDKTWELITHILISTMESIPDKWWPAMEVLDGISAYLPTEDCNDADTLAELAYVIARSGHEEKHLIVRKFFNSLISRGNDAMVEKIAIATTSPSFDLPALWAIQCFSQSKEQDNKVRIERLMSYVVEPDTRLQALAATHYPEQLNEFETLYVDLIGLDPTSSTIEYYASNLSDTLRFLDATSRAKYKEQIVNTEYWRKGLLRADSIAYLCKMLDHDDLVFLNHSIARKLSSATDRYILTSAIAVRFTELGDIEMAIQSLASVSGADRLLAKTLGRMSLLCRKEDVLSIVKKAENTLFANNRLHFYRLLLERIEQLDRSVALTICHGWLDLITKGNKVDIYTSLPALFDWFKKAQDRDIVNLLDAQFYGPDYAGRD
ncbi:serine protease [Paraflavitalea sp. CAU 1676]|uniref:serine protease n=1 Tax=Paraflavitalea sp. CAU 1676 TaxID=3032598 RepID=UPI0023DAC9CE|nr:serine protease [Paraflavitalea sp. CAU 1676]MDF2188287.1 serine protease [Paraflavitalea sp. CAU 1676]